MTVGGITPHKTKFETQKDFLRNAIDKASASARSLEEFQKQLSDNYHVTLKISRGRFSYLHPERGKYITGRSLGTQYETADFLCRFPCQETDVIHFRHINLPVNKSSVCFSLHKIPDIFLFPFTI